MSTLTHKCGGELEIDLVTTPFEVRNEQTGAMDTYEGVRCSKCHEPLGLLANIKESVYEVN